MDIIEVGSDSIYILLKANCRQVLCQTDPEDFFIVNPDFD